MSSTKRGAPREGTPSTGCGFVAAKTETILTESPSKKQARRGGKRSRQKGDRAEREIVAKHVELGIHSVVFSIAVQCGADPEVIRRALCRDGQGRASGPLAAALDAVTARDAP